MNYPRINYEMTEEHLEVLMDACKPVPMIMLQCGTPQSPQENANRAWKELGKEMGFDSMTVQPIQGKGIRFFSAVPNETEEQSKKRIEQEAKKVRILERETLKKEISDREERLMEIEGE